MKIKIGDVCLYAKSVHSINDLIKVDSFIWKISINLYHSDFQNNCLTGRLKTEKRSTELPIIRHKSQTPFKLLKR